MSVDKIFPIQTGQHSQGGESLEIAGDKIWKSRKVNRSFWPIGQREIIRKMNKINYLPINA